MRKEEPAKKAKAYRTLNSLLKKDNGILVHKKARKAGIHPEYIQRFKK